MTPAELFHRAATALYGDQYVAPMAALLNVEKNTLRNWATAKSRVPPGVWPTIVTAIEGRERDLGLVRNELKEMASPRTDAPHVSPAGTSLLGAPAPIVVGRNSNEIIIELSREVTERDHHAFRVSFEQFTGQIGQTRGRVASAGRRLQGLLRENLEGPQTLELRDWFNTECDRINREG